MRRLKACVETWPECHDGDYHPYCCRWPKSCSCSSYNEDYVKEEDLECDQDGTPTSSGYVLRSHKEQTVDEPNMDVSSPKTTEFSQRDTTDLLVVDLHAWLDNALEDFCRMRNVDRLVATRIALVYMQNKMLSFMPLTQEELLFTSQANNATCVENLHKQQESCESSGLTEKNDLTLSQFKTRLWNQSRMAWKRRNSQRIGGAGVNRPIW